MIPGVNRLIAELTVHPVNTNGFFLAFRDQHFTPHQLQAWFHQYHYFCKHFVKILEGLLYRTPVDELAMRVELTKTLYSELGNGAPDQAHIRLLERFAGALGIAPADLDKTRPVPEVQEYLSLLHRLFLDEAYLVALGAELAVEVTAAAEFRYFYPGLLRYEHFSAWDLAFFALHTEAEDDHGAWLTAAVTKTARSEADLDQVVTGARAAADGWQRFWDGMHRHVLHPADQVV
jgi:pyrroloquinoline-quinone synthase